ncbi:hypothetical protein ACTG9Q_05345 [Actinokineospora sp. 24-640]
MTRAAAVLAMAGALAGGTVPAGADTVSVAASVEVEVPLLTACVPNDWPWLLPKPC